MNTITLARQNELDLLCWLFRFGYLTPAQLGRLLWPSSTNAGSRLRMAQRLVSRLAADDKVLVKLGAPGFASHVGLAAKGAAQVRRELGVERIETAKDLLRTISSHRDAANDCAIALIQQGWSSVWSEREILSGRAPFREFGRKVPDCAAFDPEFGVLWVEIENSRRGGRDMQKLASWLAHWAFPSGTPHAALLEAPKDQHWLGRVRFVMTAPAAATFPERLRQAMAVHGWHPEDSLNRIEFVRYDDEEIELW